MRSAIIQTRWSIPASSFSASCKRGMYADLRAQSAAQLIEMGLRRLCDRRPECRRAERHDVRGVGTDRAPCCRKNAPRYLMGVGTPLDLVRGGRAGCRHVRLRDADPLMPGTAPYLRDTASFPSSRLAIETMRARSTNTAGCYTCRHFSRAYLRHLFMAKEILSSILKQHT